MKGKNRWKKMDLKMGAKPIAEEIGRAPAPRGCHTRGDLGACSMCGNGQADASRMQRVSDQMEINLEAKKEMENEMKMRNEKVFIGAVET